MKFIYSLLLCLSLLFSANAQNAGLFQTYAILNIDGGGNLYREGFVGPENFYPPLNGVNFGLINTSIFLNGGEVKTYKNSGGDVTGATMYYRVYQQGNLAPAYTAINLPFGQNFANGDQSWTTTNAGINLAAGLPSGNYILNVYFTISANTGNGGPFVDGSAANPVVATFSITNTTLPVTLASFTAKATNLMARLDWTTASEIANAHFDIERSLDAQTFTRIGHVVGQGTTTTRQQYSFSDETPASGANYYRLKQVDADGTFSYSPIRAVLIRANGELTILGNPVGTDINIAGLIPGSTAELLDMNGQRHHWQAVVTDRLQLDVRGLQTGTYLLRVVEPTGIQTRRVLIAR
ncbi:T9SS type A sorting domain-containing protein [uncultured Fibrella sp.]|uniref:T9SS type A sorting domain-containing protein n=1 Tax=uncultured Fibrella sp. TaxID=1284596 RepID=UPI0035CB5AAA